MPFHWSASRSRAGPCWNLRANPDQSGTAGLPAGSPTRSLRYGPTARRTPPDKWRGELEGLHISHNGESIPVTVRVQWTDGTEGEVSAWTSQWTRTHVCVYRETAPPYHTFWVRAGDVRRRETDA